MLLHVFGVVLRRLSLVHGVEIELGVIVLDWLEVHPKGLLDAVGWSQLVGPRKQSMHLQSAPSRVDVDRFYILLTAHCSVLSSVWMGGGRNAL